MSVLDAFLSTWSNARSTFGGGTPQTGAQYDSHDTQIYRAADSCQSANRAADQGRLLRLQPPLR